MEFVHLVDLCKESDSLSDKFISKFLESKGIKDISQKYTVDSNIEGVEKIDLGEIRLIRYSEGKYYIRDNSERELKSRLDAKRKSRLKVLEQINNDKKTEFKNLNQEGLPEVEDTKRFKKKVNIKERIPYLKSMMQMSLTLQRDIVLDILNTIKGRVKRRGLFYRFINSQKPIYLNHLNDSDMQSPTLTSFSIFNLKGEMLKPSFIMTHLQGDLKERFEVSNTEKLIFDMYTEQNVLQTKGGYNIYYALWLIIEMYKDGEFDEYNWIKWFEEVLLIFQDMIEVRKKLANDPDLWKLPHFKGATFMVNWDSLWSIKCYGVVQCLYGFVMNANAKATERMWSIYTKACVLLSMGRKIDLPVKNIIAFFQLYPGAYDVCHKKHSHPTYPMSELEVRDMLKSKPSLRPVVECKKCDLGQFKVAMKSRRKAGDSLIEKIKESENLLKFFPELIDDMLIEISDYYPHEEWLHRVVIISQALTLPFLPGRNEEVMARSMEKRDERVEKHMVWRNESKANEKEYEETYANIKLGMKGEMIKFFKSYNNTTPHEIVESSHTNATTKSAGAGSMNLIFKKTVNDRTFKKKGRDRKPRDNDPNIIKVSDTSKKGFLLFGTDNRDIKKKDLFTDTPEDLIKAEHVGRTFETGQRYDQKEVRTIYIVVWVVHFILGLVYRSFLNSKNDVHEDDIAIPFYGCNYAATNFLKGSGSMASTITYQMQLPQTQDYFNTFRDASAFDQNSGIKTEPERSACGMFASSFAEATVEMIGKNPVWIACPIVNIDGKGMNYIELALVLRDVFNTRRTYKIKSKSGFVYISITSTDSGLLPTFLVNTMYNDHLDNCWFRKLFNEAMSKINSGTVDCMGKLIAGDDFGDCSKKSDKSKFTELEIEQYFEVLKKSELQITMPINYMKSSVVVTSFAQKTTCSGMLTFDKPILIIREKESSSSLVVDDLVGLENAIVLLEQRKLTNFKTRKLMTALGRKILAFGINDEFRIVSPTTLTSYVQTLYGGSGAGLSAVNDPTLYALEFVGYNSLVTDVIGVAMVCNQKLDEHTKQDVFKILSSEYDYQLKFGKPSGNIEVTSDNKQINVGNLKYAVRIDEEKLSKSKTFLDSLTLNQTQRRVLDQVAWYNLPKIEIASYADALKLEEKATFNVRVIMAASIEDIKRMGNKAKMDVIERNPAQLAWVVKRIIWGKKFKDVERRITSFFSCSDRIRKLIDIHGQFKGRTEDSNPEKNLNRFLLKMKAKTGNFVTVSQFLSIVENFVQETAFGNKLINDNDMEIILKVVFNISNPQEYKTELHTILMSYQNLAQYSDANSLREYVDVYDVMTRISIQSQPYLRNRYEKFKKMLVSHTLIYEYLAECEVLHIEFKSTTNLKTAGLNKIIRSAIPYYQLLEDKTLL